LRRSAIILIATALGLIASVVFGGLTLPQAGLIFLVIAGAALVPWHLHQSVPNSEDIIGARPAEMPVVQALVGGMPDAAVLLDRAGRVLHFNTAASQLAPALRKNELALFALRSPEIIAALREAIATRQPQRASYVDHVPIDRWMELIVTPLSLPTAFGGSEYCILMTFHDQTALRRVEEMRADFVANASHELRTPLAALVGLHRHVAGTGAGRSEGARTLPRHHARTGDAHGAADRRSAVVVASRTQRPCAPGKLVDVVPLIRQVVDGLEPLASERQVTIELGLPPSPVMIAGDTEELLRVFENLIENGLKYGASGGRVIVSLTEPDADDAAGELRVAVRDYGPGIPPEHLPRLTERFYRVDVGDSRAQGGTGLGLSLVKHILNRHRGRLVIESVSGQGATFTACFPATRTAGAETVAVKE
jgi:two-component system phosphate regulon sensor histidine kinase PhoR